MRREGYARLVVILLVIAALGIPAWGWWQRTGWIDIRARMPEAGGWDPADLTIQTGEPLRLRLTSEDVTHSFAIGQSDRPAVDISPGEVTELVLTFDKPGTYTFYCTRWCGPNHWRMRGTITVVGDEAGQVETPLQPLYLQFGIDLDASHESVHFPSEIPSAIRGEAIVVQHNQVSIPQYQYQATSPVSLWEMLRADSSADDLSDQQLWDIVAWLWDQNTTPEALAVGEELYQRDCAACHGSTGNGEGIFSETMDSMQNNESEQKEFGQKTEPAADFTDPTLMMGASPALLQGKIIRGGMGTGMPSWGLIYTEEQTWNLVDYLWTFQFEFSEEYQNGK